MPELPEVEALRRSLSPYILNQTINSVEVKMPKLVSAKGTTRKADPDKVAEFIQGLKGKRITGLQRRAKNIIFELEDDSRMIVHLKMTGQLVFQSHNSNTPEALGGHPIQDSETSLPNKHTYVILGLSNGNLYYNDVRQFGYLLYYPNQTTLEQDGHFKGLGMEPLKEPEPEFIFEEFYKGLKSKTSPIKKVFLDQSVVVGLGNIYADEVCFAAGVKPTRKANKISKKEAQQMFDEIKRILQLAVKLGGSSVANYLLADGSRGNYAREHKVYGRGNKPCLKCNTPLKKIELASRTTVYCPVDQK